MIRSEWPTLVYTLFGLAVVLWVIALFGCASNDPIAPIQVYRAEQGFPSTY